MKQEHFHSRKKVCDYYFFILIFLVYPTSDKENGTKGARGDLFSIIPPVFTEHPLCASLS